MADKRLSGLNDLGDGSRSRDFFIQHRAVYDFLDRTCSLRQMDKHHALVERASDEFFSQVDMRKLRNLHVPQVLTGVFPI